MAFDFIQGLDCDPLELDRRLKQAEDNPPGPVPPPPPTPGVDFDYSTTPVLTTALPHWGNDFADVAENSIVLKDNGAFINLGIAYTKKMKLFVRAWSPRTPYSNKAGSGFSAVSMLYLGDDSCDFSNDGELPTLINETTLQGSIVVDGYSEFKEAFGLPYHGAIGVKHFFNISNPLQNCRMPGVTYYLSGDFDASDTLSFLIYTECCDKGEYGGAIIPDDSGFTKMDTFARQKVLEFQDGCFWYLQSYPGFYWLNEAYKTKLLHIPNMFGRAFTYYYDVYDGVTDPNVEADLEEWPNPQDNPEPLVVHRQLEGIFPKDVELHQQDPKTYLPAGLKTPLNNYSLYEFNRQRFVTQPRSRVLIGQRFTPEYIAENLPAEWNTM